MRLLLVLMPGDWGRGMKTDPRVDELAKYLHDKACALVPLPGASDWKGLAKFRKDKSEK